MGWATTAGFLFLYLTEAPIERAFLHSLCCAYRYASLNQEQCCLSRAVRSLAQCVLFFFLCVTDRPKSDTTSKRHFFHIVVTILPTKEPPPFVSISPFTISSSSNVLLCHRLLFPTSNPCFFELDDRFACFPLRHRVFFSFLRKATKRPILVLACARYT